ncbi:MAG: hypothetical protein IH845_05500 [Nanoarchaeota archaeon]|nr:hypothetical protein [Nanoarchaeota archaeon]
MPKNSHLHVVVETEFLNYLKKEAKERGISVSELCRLKLMENLQLDRIEGKIDKLVRKAY